MHSRWGQKKQKIYLVKKKSVKMAGVKHHISKYSKVYAILFLLVLIIAIFLSLPGKEKTSFKIEDKCGRFVNLMAHTVQDERSCEIRCRSQCESYGYSYKKSEFTKIENSCNSCTCYCY